MKTRGASIEFRLVFATGETIHLGRLRLPWNLVKAALYDECIETVDADGVPTTVLLDDIWLSYLEKP